MLIPHEARSRLLAIVAALICTQAAFLNFVSNEPQKEMLGTDEIPQYTSGRASGSVDLHQEYIAAGWGDYILSEENYDENKLVQAHLAGVKVKQEIKESKK